MTCLFIKQSCLQLVHNIFTSSYLHCTLICTTQSHYLYINPPTSSHWHAPTAIVLFTDGERVDSRAEQDQILQLVHQHTVSLFIFAFAGKLCVKVRMLL